MHGRRCETARPSMGGEPTVTIDALDLYDVLQVHPRAHPTVVTAAYRALARIWHPDANPAGAQAAMVRLNRAYAILRDPATRGAYDQQRERKSAPAAPTPSPQPNRMTAPKHGTTLNYGRYAGWTLDQLARHDPDYLRWLSRHTSGLRLRPEIERLLNARPTAATPIRRK